MHEGVLIMKKFEVTITRTGSIIVEAESFEDAVAMIKSDLDI